MHSRTWLLGCALLTACTSSGSSNGGAADHVDAGHIAPLEGGACRVSGSSEPGVVVTDRGAVHGATDGSAWAYLNIPFAAAPVGDRRWKLPEPHACWEDTRDATAWGPVCPQLDAAGKPFGDEDCLQLNVFTPDPAPKDAPVMVWIHGGGHAQGSAAAEAAGVHIYDGHRFASRTGVVLVSINYRLGPLGFLAHPSLDPEGFGSSGNLGTLDQIAALEWVRNNVRAFGGDPSKVTIFGESAGAVSVCTLVASPIAKGLFSGAIMQSGGCVAKTRAQAEEHGQKVLAASGCAASTDPAVCLGALPATTVLTALPAVIQVAGPSSDYGSVIDGNAVMDVPSKVIAAGQHNEVPMIVGANTEETSRSVPPGIDSEAAFRAAVTALIPLPNLANRIFALYPVSDYASPKDAFIAVTTDAKFLCTAGITLRALAAGQTDPRFRYLFSHAPEGAAPAFQAFGAWHGLDVLYVFDTLDEIPGYAATEGDRRVVDSFASYWSAFARSGDPNAGNQVAWPAHDGTTDPYLRIDDPPIAEAAYRKAQCDLWASLTP